MPITIDEELDAELDRILGNRLLFDLDEPQRYGGPSVPTLYRMRRDGLIEFTKSGGLVEAEPADNETAAGQRRRSHRRITKRPPTPAKAPAAAI